MAGQRGAGEHTTTRELVKHLFGDHPPHTHTTGWALGGRSGQPRGLRVENLTKHVVRGYRLVFMGDQGSEGLNMGDDIAVDRILTKYYK